MMSSHQQRLPASSRLDMNHGFVKKIQACLQERAREEGMVNTLGSLSDVPGRRSLKKKNKVENTTSSCFWNVVPHAYHEDVTRCASSFGNYGSQFNTPPLSGCRSVGGDDYSMSSGMGVIGRPQSAADLNMKSESYKALTPALTSTQKALLKSADLERFVPVAQIYIEQAIVDVHSLSASVLDDVGRCLVERAQRDEGYYRVASDIVRHVVLEVRSMSAVSTSSSESFVMAVLDECHAKLLAHRQNPSIVTDQFIHNCLLLLCEIHRLFRRTRLPVQLVVPVLHAALREVIRHCLRGEEVRSLRHVIFEYGDDFLVSFSEDLVNELTDLVRDAFLDVISVTEVDQEVKKKWSKDLLLIVELLATDFMLNDEAKQYYFLESSDVDTASRLSNNPLLQ